MRPAASQPVVPEKEYIRRWGLATGLYLLALADKAMYTERDVELRLKLPILTIVPAFETTGAAKAS
jgi:hypothetical protein